MYCLWIGGKKVYDLKQLKENFDFDSVEIYCLGGGLVRWLRQCGETEAAEKVEKIDPSSNLREQLAEIFDQPDPIKKSFSDTAPVCITPEISRGKLSSFAANDVLSDGGSFAAAEKTDSFNFELSTPSSHEISSFGGSSFEAATVFSGSGAALSTSFPLETSSYNLFSTSYNLFSNSFNLFSTSFNLFSTSFSLITTSFVTSSFHEYECEFESGSSFAFSGGSYSLGSFGAYISGSFADTSFAGAAGSFKAENISSAVTSDRSDAGEPDGESADSVETAPPLSPSEKILQNITACPLNRFGYGIHLI